VFDRAVEALAERLDPRDLPQIYRAFSDEVEDHESFWQVVHLIDAYDWEAGAAAYVAVLPEMLETASGWMETLAIRQVNHDQARTFLIVAAGRAPAENREAVRTMLRKLASDPGHSVPRDALAERARLALRELERDVGLP